MGEPEGHLRGLERRVGEFAADGKVNHKRSERLAPPEREDDHLRTMGVALSTFTNSGTVEDDVTLDPRIGQEPGHHPTSSSDGTSGNWSVNLFLRRGRRLNLASSNRLLDSHLRAVIYIDNSQNKPMKSDAERYSPRARRLAPHSQAKCYRRPSKKQKSPLLDHNRITVIEFTVVVGLWIRISCYRTEIAKGHS